VTSNSAPDKSDKSFLSQERQFRGEPRCKEDPGILAAGSESCTAKRMEDENGGLFNIEISSDESVNEVEKVPRDFQSEEDFQKQKRNWKVKTEKGEVSC